MAQEVTLREALIMYRDRVSIFKKGYAQEKYRIDLYCRHPIADMRMREITSVEIASFRDDRLRQIVDSRLNLTRSFHPNLTHGLCA